MATKFEVRSTDFDDLFEPERTGFNSVEFDRKYLAPQNMTGPMRYMARTGDATNPNTDYYYYENETWKLFDAHPIGYEVPKSLAISSGDWTGSYQYTRTSPTHNMKFTVTWQDGKTEDVTSDVTISPSTWGDTTGTDVYNTQIATFSYTHHGITVSVTKSATVYRKLTDLTIGGSWSNNQYYKYAPTTAGLTATASFNTGQTADVAVKTTTDAWGSSDADYNTQTATFSYSENGQNVSATYRATVYKYLDRLEVSGEWSNTQYYDSAPNINGLTFTAYYNNNTYDENVTPSVSPVKWANTGIQAADFSFTKYGISQTTSKTAIVYAVLDGLEVSENWSNYQYYNYTPDITGLIFTAHYNTGASETVTSSVTVVTTKWEGTGTQTAYFSYTKYGISQTTSKTATVYAALDRLEVSGNWSNYQYYNDAPTIDGLIFTAHYNTGASETVTSSVTVVTTKWEGTGIQAADFSYTKYGISKTTSKDATVYAVLTSLTVSGNWKHTQYYGYAPDTAGLLFTAYFNTGSSSTVTPSVISPSIWQNIGPQTATFSYTYPNQGKTASTSKNVDVFMGIILNTFQADSIIASLSFT